MLVPYKAVCFRLSPAIQATGLKQEVCIATYLVGCSALPLFLLTLSDWSKVENTLEVDRGFLLTANWWWSSTLDLGYYLSVIALNQCWKLGKNVPDIPGHPIVRNRHSGPWGWVKNLVAYGPEEINIRLV